jgi:AcrR family transcriptional regulator
MPQLSSTDGRRDAGARTKQRLMDATLDLLAERGEDGVTLRDITGAAETNIASVSYHFGSLGALCCATTKHAITQLLDEQLSRLEALDENATVDDIARAAAQPIIAVLTDPDHPQRALLRIFDRALGGPPGELQDWIRAELGRVDDELVARLGIALPDVPADELRFRWECASGMLGALVKGRSRCDHGGRCAEDFERLLLPVIAGTLSAGAVPAANR